MITCYWSALSTERTSSSICFADRVGFKVLFMMGDLLSLLQNYECPLGISITLKGLLLIFIVQGLGPKFLGWQPIFFACGIHPNFLAQGPQPNLID